MNGRPGRGETAGRGMGHRASHAPVRERIAGGGGRAEPSGRVARGREVRYKNPVGPSADLLGH